MVITLFDDQRLGIDADRVTALQRNGGLIAQIEQGIAVTAIGQRFLARSGIAIAEGFPGDR